MFATMLLHCVPSLVFQIKLLHFFSLCHLVSRYFLCVTLSTATFFSTSFGQLTFFSPCVLVNWHSFLYVIWSTNILSLCHFVSSHFSPCHMVTWSNDILFYSPLGHVTFFSACHLVMWHSFLHVIWSTGILLFASLRQPVTFSRVSFFFFLSFIPA